MRQITIGVVYRNSAALSALNKIRVQYHPKKASRAQSIMYCTAIPVELLPVCRKIVTAVAAQYCPFDVGVDTPLQFFTLLLFRFVLPSTSTRN